ncbi:PilN domain-containing protein [Desulfovulcanus sp.]
MIKINLLPQSKRVKVSNVGKEAILFFLGVMVLLVGVLGTNYWLQARIEKFQALEREKQAEKASLFIKVARVNKLKKELESVQTKIKIIKEIRQTQNFPIHYIDELISNLPESKIWFESFNLDKEGRINLRGVALDNQIFAYYVQKLRSSPYIKEVITQRTSRRKILTYDLVEFQCQILARTIEKQSGS